MCNLFGGSSCTWVLILVIVFLLSQDCCEDETPSCGCARERDRDCGCDRDRDRDCDCGCGCIR